MSLIYSKRNLNLFLIPFFVSLVACGGGGGSSTVVEEEPITPPVEEPMTPAFDSGLLTDGGFEDASDAWSGNALNPQPEDGNATNTVNFAEVGAAGDPFAVNLSQMVEITQGRNYTLSFDAKSDGNRTILAGIGLNEEPFTNFTETINLTADFQTFTVTAPAANFGGLNSRILFDMGAETGQVIIDNVKLVDAGEIVVVAFDDGLLTNGNFENGTDSWTGNASQVTDELLGVDASRANFANLETAAASPFQVNLSQVVAITEGDTYTLTFTAKSDRERTMIAGIGLFEGDFANTAEEINLTTEFQTYTLVQTATFGSDNSRVLFDMGAEAGVIIIDNVSLFNTTP